MLDSTYYFEIVQICDIAVPYMKITMPALPAKEVLAA